jgi:putative ABC transport system permease protein
VSEDDLKALLREPGVAAIEGVNRTAIEWKVNPEDEWRRADLVARPDYENQRFSILALTEGHAWPHQKVLSVEEGSDTFFGVPIPGTVILRVNDREVVVPVGGTLYNPLSQPAYFGGNAQFYATQDTFRRLVGNADYQQLMVSAQRWDEDEVADLADRLQNKLEEQGRCSYRMITDPNKHFFQDQIDGLFFILTVMGMIALLLGLLLVYNTMNALVARQVDQIGVLKAVGARTGQVLRMFLAATLVYGLLALLLALPLGIWGSYKITTWLSGSFGAEGMGYEISQTAIIAMVLITILAPLLASLFPIFAGARVTVREAIATYGLSKKTGLLDRLGTHLLFAPRMLLLTISNTFRNKGRVILMEITLVLSGLFFMMVITTRESILYTVNDVLFEILGADITMVFEAQGGSLQHIDHLQKVALAHPDVKSVEAWIVASGNIRPMGQPESEDDEGVTMFGVPLPTEMYGYQMRGGRWLEAIDDHAIVLNRKLAEEVGVGIGDWVTIKYDDTLSHDWQVVGLVFDPLIIDSANVPRDILLHDLHLLGEVNTIWINTYSQDIESQKATAVSLRKFFDANNIAVSPQRGVFGIGGDATAETAQTLINQFEFVIVLMAIMAVIIGGVGAIALSGSLSLSVMERTREIGVLRAVGASSWQVARLFIGEGLILGWLSWLIALPLSIPAGRMMVTMLGVAFKNEYVFYWTSTGAMLWLGIITVLSIFASWLPARRATHISVRESLAYQ